MTATWWSVSTQGTVIVMTVLCWSICLMVHMRFPCATVKSRNYQNRWHWRFPWTSGFRWCSKYALWLLIVVVWTLILRLCKGDICQMTYFMWNEHFFSLWSSGSDCDLCYVLLFHFCTIKFHYIRVIVLTATTTYCWENCAPDPDLPVVTV